MSAASGPAAPIPITCWRSKSAETGARIALTWPELAEMLAAPRPRAEVERLPAWSAATFDGDRRKKELARSITALVLDIDLGAHELEALREAFAGRSAIVHNTRSAKPNAQCWRVVVGLSRNMSPVEHAKVWRAERDRLALLGVVLDEQTKDPSRLWFVPCEPAGGAFMFERFDGSPLDVDDVLRATDTAVRPPSASSPRLASSSPSLSTSSEPDWLGGISLSTRMKRAAAWLAHAETSVSGEGGHAVAMRAATGVVRGFALDTSSARAVLSDWNARCEPPWLPAELAHKVDEAAHVGAMSWGEKLAPSTSAAAPKLSVVASSTPRPLPTPADRVRSLAALGSVVRLPTNIATLDRACRGGLPTRRLVVVGGAPGAGKTSLATAWAWQWAKHGVPVGVLAVDEGPEGTIARIAQLEGIEPERIEERDPATLERLAGVLDASALILADGEDTAGNVEALAELVAKAAEETSGVGVLVVDSIQTVRAAGTESVDSPRERVDAVVRALKSVRDRFGLLVIATCELARGAYRSRNLAEAINDLAAFKESGSVEYAAQTALVLRSVPDEASLIDVTVPKNRAYRREPFRLRMDHATTAFEEVEMPAEPSSAGPRRPTDTLDRDAAELRKLLVVAPGINGARAVRTALRARHVAMSNDRVQAALEFLRTRGELVNRGSERRPALHLQTAQTEEVESDE